MNQFKEKNTKESAVQSPPEYNKVMRGGLE